MLFGSDKTLWSFQKPIRFGTLSPLPLDNCFPLAIEQDGVGMKHSTEAAQGRVAQGGLSRNGRIYRIAYRKCLKRKRRRKLPLFGLRCLGWFVRVIHIWWTVSDHQMWGISNDKSHSQRTRKTTLHTQPSHSRLILLPVRKLPVQPCHPDLPGHQPATSISCSMCVPT